MLLPLHGSESNWLKNLAKDPHIELRVEDVSVQSKAKLVRDSSRAKEVLDKFKAKYQFTGYDWTRYTKRDVCVEVPV